MTYSNFSFFLQESFLGRRLSFSMGGGGAPWGAHQLWGVQTKSRDGILPNMHPSPMGNSDLYDLPSVLHFDPNFTF